MILFIEGPRGSGKTFLINKFLEECKDPRLEYYKFYFADHVKMLGLEDLDANLGLHYFSLGNIMTILEMNQRPEYSDRIWVFDRAIISAYSWAVLRNRMTQERADAEYMKLIGSSLFQNCKTLYVTVSRQTVDNQRVKDTWDAAHSTSEENAKLNHFFYLGFDQLSSNNQKTMNDAAIVQNNFDFASIDKFKTSCYSLLNLKPDK